MIHVLGYIQHLIKDSARRGPTYDIFVTLGEIILLNKFEIAAAEIPIIMYPMINIEP